jgi:hypothetical protein
MAHQPSRIVEVGLAENQAFESGITAGENNKKRVRLLLLNYAP